MEDLKFEAAVGMSRKWDAREAGREVARETIKKLSRPPSFFLLFSTIHYEKHGGFQEFLNGVWDVLPEDTPLIGGTVAGFINPHGCFTRGSTAIAVSYPNMDVAIGIGKNTKRNPKQAGKNCAKMITKQLKGSNYTQKFIIDIISGGLVPQILGLGRKKVIRGGVSSKLAVNLSKQSLTISQKGVGREEEVLEEFSKYFEEYHILHGSSMDDGKAINNFQFFNKTVGTNMVVCLGISTDLATDINSNHNLKVVKKLLVTKLSKDGRIIHQINNKPAAGEFLKLLNWPEEYFDEKLFKRTFFYPLGYKKNGDWVPEIVGIILGNSINVLHRVENKEMCILSASGQNLMDAVGKSFSKNESDKTLMSIISTCDGRLEALGSEVYKVRDEIVKYLDDAPFIAIYCGGEGAKKPGEQIKYGNVTFNTFVLKEIY